MDNLHTQKVIDVSFIFDNFYLDAKKIYLYYFQVLPNYAYIGAIDGLKMYKSFKDQFEGLIVQENQYQEFEGKRNGFEFSTSFLLLNNHCVMEFDDGYCKIFHDGQQEAFLKAVAALSVNCKERKKREPQEINLIVKGGRGMALKAMAIKRTKLDLDLFYEDDFKAVDDLIRKRLNQKKDKGIVLLHGLPGTGKTTYLRFLVGKIRKRVLFLSPNVAGDLMSPDFIDLLIDNPDTVLIIEDAENIIMDRRNSPNSSVSNLLNISDGMLADFLNVQIICTFNSELTLVDSALLRKGRLIAQYEFGRLGIEKSRRLSKHLGFDQEVTRPMTVAEISNQHEGNAEIKQQRVFGFRREAMEN